MMIPDWVWPLVCTLALLALAWHDERKIKRHVENFRAVEAERAARANTAPLGNVDRYYA